jgi:hypothetical protein
VCAAGRKPTTIAAVLVCSRASVDRTGRASRAGTLPVEHDDQGRRVSPGHPTGLLPTLRRSLVARLKTPPRAYGWCRPRWSGATLALTRQTTRGLTVSAETRRRWVHAGGWVWKRTTLVAKDDAPYRVERLARLRFVDEPWRRGEAVVVAAARAMHLRPQVG